MSDPGIYSHEHRAMSQFGSFLSSQASVSPVSFPVNNMHFSASLLPPLSAVLIRTMSSITINVSFANVQADSLPVLMLLAQPGTGFVSLSPAFAGGDFSSSGVNPPPFFLLASHFHASPVQTQHNFLFVTHTVSPNINDYYTSDANLSLLAAPTTIVTFVQCFYAGNIFF